jgi:tetratricopeptide (TPR) repeat protein
VIHRSNMGGMLVRLGRQEEALEALRAAAADTSTASVWNNLGGALGSLGRFEEALEALEQAKELDPEDSTALMNLGVCLDNLDRPADALASYSEAAESAPDDADIQNLRANSLRRLGRLEEAEGAAARAIDLAPGEHVYRFTQAEISLMGEDRERALAELREALRLWRRREGHRPGEPELVCRILWGRLEAGQEYSPLVGQVAEAYDEAGAGEELGQGLVSTIPLIAAAEVELERARAWLAAWEEAPPVEALSIPLSMLRATVAWKQDRNRSHLLELPQEQRKILTELLADAL